MPLGWIYLALDNVLKLAEAGRVALCARKAEWTET